MFQKINFLFLKKNLMNIFNVTFLIIFLWIYINILLNNNTWFVSQLNIFFIFFNIIIFILLYKILLKINSFFKNRTHIILFLAIIILQIICIYNLKVNSSWDFDTVFGIAKNISQGKEFDEYYLYQFRNNIGISLFFAIIYKIFHVTNYYNVSCIVNIFIIDLSIFLSYKLIKNKFNYEKALMFLSLCLGTTPLYTYSTIFYTDTISMVYPVLIYCIYLKLKENKNIYFYSVLLGVTAFLGSIIKFSVIIILIACLIDMILKNKIKFIYKKITLIILSYILSSIIFCFVINSSKIFSFNMYSKSPIPPQHWVMMGLTGDGGWSGKEFDFTYKLIKDNDSNRKSVEKAINNKIIERLKNYKVNGYIKFLTYKNINTWGDGTYFAPEKLKRQPIRNTLLHDIVLGNRKYFNYFAYFSQTTHIIVLTGILLSIFYALKNKKQDDLDILRIVVFGLVLFFSLWEMRSRYLVNYIPIFLILTVSVDYNKFYRDLKNILFISDKK